jgi:hypothetical protein
MMTFEPFRAEDTVFHLNEDIIKTFNGMVFADVLATNNKLSKLYCWTSVKRDNLLSTLLA